MIAPVWLIGGGLTGLMGAIALYQHVRQRKRREALTEYCQIRGFTFEPKRPGGERRFRDVFEPFQQGQDNSWRNTISGAKNGAPFIAFEYVWTTGSGRSRRTHHRSGLIWESDAVSFPKFALAPEGWFSRLGEFFGLQDIDFTDAPEFSQAYRLTGPNESAIRQLFTPEIRQFLAATPDQHVTGGGRFLIWWFDSELPAADELDEWLERGDHVRRRFFTK